MNPSTTAKKPAQVQTEKGEPAKREYRWIPTSWEAASPEDKMLVTMREAGGSWSTIQRKWEDMTGTEVGASTLPRRYNRIIANCAHLAEGDVRGDVRIIISVYFQCLSVKRLAHSKKPQNIRIFEV